MEGAAEPRGAEIDHGIAREEPAQGGILDPLFDRGHVLPRDRPAEDVVDELEIAPTRQRLHPALAVSELAVAAGLLLVPALVLGDDGVRVASSVPFLVSRHLNAESALV